MKRRWSNNGGFAALRMLEESSSEVTSSSNGLVLSSDINMSPSSLDSPIYGDQEMWHCNESAAANYNAHQHSVITSLHGCTSSLPAQTTIIPLPPLQNGNSNQQLQQQQHQQQQHHQYTNSTNANSNGLSAGITSLNGLNNMAHTNLHQHHQQAHHTNGIGGNGPGLTHVANIKYEINSQQSQPNSLSTNAALHGSNGSIHSLSSNGLQNHLNNGNNMLHHTPRSESVNSISSGELKINFYSTRISRQQTILCHSKNNFTVTLIILDPHNVYYVYT